MKIIILFLSFFWSFFLQAAPFSDSIVNPKIRTFYPSSFFIKKSLLPVVQRQIRSLATVKVEVGETQEKMVLHGGAFHPEIFSEILDSFEEKREGTSLEKKVNLVIFCDDLLLEKKYFSQARFCPEKKAFLSQLIAFLSEKKYQVFVGVYREDPHTHVGFIVKNKGHAQAVKVYIMNSLRDEMKAQNDSFLDFYELAEKTEPFFSVRFEEKNSEEK
jgi:hypothetical protein